VNVHPLDLFLNNICDTSRFISIHTALSVKCLRECRFTEELLHNRLAVPWEDESVTGPDAWHVFGLFAKERRLEAAGLKHRKQ